MRMYFVASFVIFSGLISPLVADPKPVFHGAWHRNQLIGVAVATVLAHPLACGVDAFRKPVGRDILEKQTFAKSAKAAIRAMFTKEAWLSPYTGLARSLKKDPTRGIHTKWQALGTFVKNHKAFVAAGSVLVVDAAVVATKYAKHSLDLRNWEKDEPARLAATEKAKKESSIKELWRLLGRLEESFDGKDLDVVLADLEEQYVRLAAGFKNKISTLESQWPIAHHDLGDKPTVEELKARLKAANASVDAAKTIGFVRTGKPTVGPAPSKPKLANMFQGSPTYAVLSHEDYTPTANASPGLRFVEIGKRVLGRESDGAGWRELDAKQIAEYETRKDKSVIKFKV